MQITTRILAAQPFLAGLSEPQLGVLANNSMPAAFEADQFIFFEGDPANRFYLILEGEIVLEAPIDEGGFRKGAVPIETIGAGSVLGWSWLFPPYYWHFDARAITPVKAIFFYGTTLREQCERDHDLGYELMRRLSEVVIKRLQMTRVQILKPDTKPTLAT